LHRFHILQRGWQLALFRQFAQRLTRGLKSTVLTTCWNSSRIRETQLPDNLSHQRDRLATHSIPTLTHDLFTCLDVLHGRTELPRARLRVAWPSHSGHSVLSSSDPASGRS